MADYYGSIDAVLIRTGIKPEDLGFIAEDDDSGSEGDDEFGVFIANLLREIADLMDRKMRKSYLEEDEIPHGLDGIANDICADSLRTMVVGRQTPVVRIDDFAVRTVTARTFSQDILDRLKLYSAGQGVGSYDIVQGDISDLSVTDVFGSDLEI